MKKHACMTVLLFGIMVLQATSVAAAGSVEDFYGVVTWLGKNLSTNSQTKYSSQLRQSLNAGAIQHLEQQCARSHASDQVQTFSLVGIMRLDGVISGPTLLPRNAFTDCVARDLDSVSFPLPPGNGKGWPVAMQIDGYTGKILYVSGDSQRAMPIYRRKPSTRTLPWIYTPVPVLGSNQLKPCDITVWVSVAEAGHVDGVDVANSSCAPAVQKAVEAAAGQWLYLGAPGKTKVASRDVRLSFSVKNRRFHVKL